MEYRWIKEPTPVTMSIMVIDSASIWNAKGTFIVLTLIQSKSFTMCVPPSCASC